MFKRLLLLGSFAILPVAAKGSTPSDDAGLRTMSVATGQGAWLRITIPTHANLQQPVQAPYALTGTSFTNLPHHYLQIDIGQGGWVQVQAD